MSENASPSVRESARFARARAQMDTLLDLIFSGYSVNASLRLGTTFTDRRQLSAALKYPELRRDYDDALEQATEAMAEEAIEVLDTEPDVQRARAKSEARRWLAGCRNPRKYGPKMEVHQTGQVSVLAAMDGAQMRSMHDLAPVYDAQVIDVPTISTIGAADSVSVAPAETLPGELG